MKRKRQPLTGKSHKISGLGRAQELLTHFLNGKTGTTAVEFGLLALPFLGLVTACLENALVYWQQELLQEAVVEAGRQLYTGKFQTANSGATDMAALAAKFRSSICTQSNGAPRLTIFDCSTVRVSVTQADTLAGAVPVSPTSIDAKGVITWNPQFQSYVCAGASAIMVVQAAVDMPAYFPLLGSSASRLSTGRRIIQAATVFKAEPYTTKSVCS